MAVHDAAGKRYHSNTAMRMHGGAAPMTKPPAKGTGEASPKLGQHDKPMGEHEEGKEHNDVSHMPINEVVEEHGPAHTIHMTHHHDGEHGGGEHEGAKHHVHSIHGHEGGGHHHKSDHETAEDAHDHARKAAGLDAPDTNDEELGTYEPEGQAETGNEMPAIPGL